MAEPKEPRTAKPESLEAKFKLLALLPYDKRAKRKHSLVFGFILDWYHSRYGDALASVRHVAAIVKERDPAGVGLYIGDVHAALTDLVAWGYLTQEIGKGRKASRYVPVWAKLDSVREIPNTTDHEICVRENQNTSVREIPNTNGDSVRESPNQDPSTSTRVTDPETRKDEVDCAPPADGLAATAVTQEGFDELYATYAVKKSKADARRAYDKLAPDADLHARMMTAAVAWRRTAGDTVERMHLRRWIEEERYDEEPNGARQPVEKKAKAAEPVMPAKPAKADVAFHPTREVMTILEASISKEGASTWIDLVLRADDGTGDDVSICLEASNADLQSKGQRQLEQIISASGLTSIVDDATELVGAKFVRVLPSKFGEYEYEPAPGNDNRRPFSDTIITHDDEPKPAKVRPPAPRFADIVANTPLHGWASRLGTDYDDEEEDAA